METQEKQSSGVPEFIAPGLFRDAKAVCYPAESGARAAAKALNSKGRAFLAVSGKSMLPWFRPGDIIFLRKTDLREISRGDVVVFERDGRLCMHRVITLCSSRRNGEENSAWFVTKGDSVAEADEPIYAREFRGQVEFLYRHGREIRLDSAWRKLLGKCLAVISPAGRFWLPHFRRLKNQLDNVTASSCDSLELRSPERPHSI
ncbi:MAG: signal peptidase I [Candidatus Acidiferrales bacterium]